MSVMEFSGIRRSYQRGIEVLEGVSFSVEPGEVVGLVGRNGVGKTTLIRIAMGLLAPQQGTVRLFGLDPRRAPLEVKRRVGYVSEEQVLPDFLRVSEVLQLHRKLFPTWDRALEEDLLSRFELRVNARIKHLSKGQARQVALLCAIAHRPELLLLDEPAGGLDPAVRRLFLETAIRYLNDSGTTILFSSHYMGDLERLASRIVMLHEGSVLLDHPLDHLREGFSLVVLPLRDGPGRDAIMDLDPCLAVRERNQSLHAVLRLEAAEAKRLMAERFNLAEVRCQSIPLEEMFIEITGGRS